MYVDSNLDYGIPLTKMVPSCCCFLGSLYDVRTTKPEYMYLFCAQNRASGIEDGGLLQIRESYNIFITKGPYPHTDFYRIGVRIGRLGARIVRL